MLPDEPCVPTVRKASGFCGDVRELLGPQDVEKRQQEDREEQKRDVPLVLERLHLPATVRGFTSMTTKRKSTMIPPA